MGQKSIKIIYENNDLAVIDKPADLTVHKTSDNDKQPTLVDYLVGKWPEIKNPPAGGWPDSSRAGIVHRLDKDTSGLIIIAINPETQKTLQEQFKHHSVKKIYTLLCFGKTPEKGEIKTLTTRDDKLYNKQKMSLMNFSWQKGKSREAITTYKNIKYYDFDGQVLSLVEAQILTGRTHQIRNHFKFIDHPVIGDQMYFTKESKQISDKLGLMRQFLHSSNLNLNIDDKNKSFHSDLPDDLQKVLGELKLK